MTLPKLLPLLLPALLATGCSSTGMPPPGAPQTAAYTRAGELPSLSQRLALGHHLAAQWWTLFASPPLDTLIRTGVSGNYDLAAARERLAQAQEEAAARAGERLPQLSMGADIGRQKYGPALFGPADFAIPPFNYYEIGPTLSWQPDLFGRTHHAIERERALAAYQAHQLDAVYVALTANITTEALQLATVNAELAIAQRIIADDRKTLGLVKAAYSLGAASRMDVLNAQARVVSDSALLPGLQRRRAASGHTLAILLGKAPADWTPPALELGEFTLPGKLPLSLPSELARQRPDILAAEDAVHAAGARVGEAKANLYPHVTLSANMMQEALSPARVFSGVDAAWALAAGLSAPLFDGGTLQAQKRAAEHAYAAALAQYRQTVLRAFGDVADSLTDLDHDDQAVAIKQEAVRKARSTRDLTLAGYHSGAIGLLQVESTQRALALARLDLLDAQQQRYLDCVRLFVALGGSPFPGTLHSPN